MTATDWEAEVGLTVPAVGVDAAPPAAVSTGPTLRIVQAKDLVLRRVRYVWAGRIPVGSMTLAPGEEGIGKTTLAIRVIADLTRGELPGEFLGHPKHVVLMAPEDGLEEVLLPRLIEAGADMDLVHFVLNRRNEDGTDQPVEVPQDLDLLDDLLAAHDVGMVYIDALAATLPEALKNREYKGVTRAIGAVNTWASDHRVAVVSPWHVNKAQGGDTAVRLMDSRGFRTAVRSMLLIVRDPDVPEGQTGGIVALDKSNAGSMHVPALRYRLRSAAYEVEELDEDTGEIVVRSASCGVADFTGEIEGDGLAYARELLAAGMGIETADDAKSWLKKYLSAKGPTPRSEVIADGKEAGHSESAIKRAASAMSVFSEQHTGQDPDSGAPRKWAVWSLDKPDVADDTAQSGHLP